MSQEVIISVTQKGQATIPKVMRDRHGIGRKVVAVDTDAGVLMRPIPGPSKEKGSLKKPFKGKSSTEIMREVRQEEKREENRIESKHLRVRKAQE